VAQFVFISMREKRRENPGVILLLLNEAKEGKERKGKERKGKGKEGKGMEGTH